MNTPIKFATIAAASLAATLSLSSPAYAGENSDTILVTSPEKMAAWKAEANDVLDRALQREPRRRNLLPGSGLVQLTFEMGDNGKPANIDLLSNSGNGASARTARLAVRWLRDLSDLPVANPQDAKFLANIIFADDQREYRELAAELNRSEAARIAAGGETSQYIALGG